MRTTLFTGLMLQAFLAGSTTQAITISADTAIADSVITETAPMVDAGIIEPLPEPVYDAPEAVEMAVDQSPIASSEEVTTVPKQKP